MPFHFFKNQNSFYLLSTHCAPGTVCTLLQRKAVTQEETELGGAERSKFTLLVMPELGLEPAMSDACVT